MERCSRTACNSGLVANCRHRQTGRMYCVVCARRINAQPLQSQLVEIPQCALCGGTARHRTDCVNLYAPIELRRRIEVIDVKVSAEPDPLLPATYVTCRVRALSDWHNSAELVLDIERDHAKGYCPLYAALARVTAKMLRRIEGAA